MHKNKITTSLVFEGSCDRLVFITYLEEILLPTYPPGTTIYIDNASIHKGKEIEEIIRKAGCFLEYIPTYSPDLNPIEHQWSPLKYKIRNKMQNENINIWDAAIMTLGNLSA